MQLIKTTFRERKVGGDIAEFIVFKAFELGIIPHRSKNFPQYPLEQFIVDESTVELRLITTEFNLRNGDIGFISMNCSRCSVDVKTSDSITERSLDNINDGCYYFLNGKNNVLPFMFKVDEYVKKIIKDNFIKIPFQMAGSDRVHYKYRILKHVLETLIPASYIYEFDVEAFCKHRTECLIELGVLKP